MGVHGLWDLLAPVGRRVSVETLSGRKLAIDASIWMVQFMKAMRDEKGEMVRNAHVLGFFRRICKLLYLRTKPVFVFDGGTPVLKRRTVIARRRQRENAQAKVRKTAEKLLLNQLKVMRLKELANNLENQRKVNSDDGAGRKKGVKGNNVEVHEMQAPSHLVVDARNSENNASTSAASSVVEEDLEGEDQTILSARGSYVDPAVLAALPPSVKHDLLSGSRSRVGDRDVDHLVGEDFSSQNDEAKKKSKGKEVLSEISSTARCNFEGDDLVADTLDQQKLDEMLAASLAAEEDDLYKNTAISDAHNIRDEESGSEDEAEEMILPVHGKVDPSILAALPPSVQLDLLVQMRERLMAENRQRYQKVKKAPEKFSELQIAAYLKTVAFRREIDEVQKAASGKVVDGVQTSRIASEANREFIFSTSFSGDKQSLTSSVPSRKNGDKPMKNTGKPSFQSVDNIASFPTSDSGTELSTGKTKIGFDEGVETYLDERGHTRVSRLRAMGMCMTRDLQRNLDLMKEIEQEQTPSIQITGSFSNEEPSEVLGSKNDNSVSLNSSHEQSMLNVGTSVQISFEIDESKCSGSDDDMFTHLASGQLIEFSSDEKEQKASQLSGSASDSDWEEGVVNGKGDKYSENVVEVHSSLKASNGRDDSEVEWEEGGFDDPVPAQSEKPVYKGDLEEDSDLQEAIRRSLKDLESHKINQAHFQTEKGETSAAKESSETARFLCRGSNDGGKNKSGGLVQKQVPSKTLGSGKQDEVSWTEKLAMPTEKSSETDFGCGYPQLFKDTVRDVSLDEEAAHINSSTNFVEESIPLVAEHSSGGLVDKEAKSLEISSEDNLPSGSPSRGLSSRDLVNGDIGDNGAEPVKLVVEEEISVDESTNIANISNPSISVIDSSRIGSNNGITTSQNLSNEVNLNYEINGGQFMENSSAAHDVSTVAHMRQTELEEEIQHLHKEYENLGVEQRKLERNADSVSGEMFAECQELLQMFGLPYIIAPMEAEAQCAYMEISGLVDGIVTDDSDVFLFGARNVYKNIFDERKYVETYFMEDVEKELGLTREKLIRMALLLGSDYTEGVSGVGIVNAIEIVNAFSEEDGLQKFREWLESPDPSILGEIGAQNCTDPRKRSSKFGDRCTKSANNTAEQSVNDVEENKKIFMDKHRNVSKNWHIPASFPSDAVIAAYLSPQVDKSTEPFSWGKPELHVLQRLCWEKLGWDIHKSNELLLPVLKEYNKHETQLRLEAFYTFNEKFAKIRSKRITKAVKGITKNQSTDITDDATVEVANTRKKRKASNDKSDDDGRERHSSGKETSSSKKNDSVKSASTRTRRKKADGQVQGGCTERYQKRSREGRGGREWGRRTKSGKTMRRSSSQQSDSSSDHEVYDDVEPYVESSEHLQEPRRSTRLRKPASYVEKDNEPVDPSTKGSDEEAAEQDLSSLQGVERWSVSDLGKNGHNEQDLSAPKPSEFNIDCQATVGTDEDEAVQQPDINLPIEVDASKDYLKMGGGFCFEETETKEDNDTSSSQRDAVLNFGNSCPLSFSEEAEANSGLLQGTSSSSIVPKELYGQDPTDFDSEKSLELGGASEIGDASNVCPPELNTKSESFCPKALTPIPFLKRKRRRD